MEGNYQVTEDDFKLTQEEIWKDISIGLSEVEEITRQQAMEILFKKEHLQDDFTDLPWTYRVFYWVKTLLCLGFCLTKGQPFSNGIIMICWNDRRLLETVSWDYCEVGSGIFRNWWVRLGTDGN